MKRYQCTRLEPEQDFVKPGFGFVPAQRAKIWTVVGSSVAVTLYDRRRKIGGMAHYTRPYRRAGLSNAFFAAPAIIWLVRHLLSLGCRREDLEAHLFGGAENPDIAEHEQGLHRDNVRAGMDVLGQAGIPIETMDVGGRRGRKVLFNVRTGESMVVRVDNIRHDDWYPALASGVR